MTRKIEHEEIVRLNLAGITETPQFNEYVVAFRLQVRLLMEFKHILEPEEFAKGTGEFYNVIATVVQWGEVLVVVDSDQEGPLFAERVLNGCHFQLFAVTRNGSRRLLDEL